MGQANIRIVKDQHTKVCGNSTSNMDMGSKSCMMDHKLTKENTLWGSNTGKDPKNGKQMVPSTKETSG
jgi:hypothetical protein